MQIDGSARHSSGPVGPGTESGHRATTFEGVKTPSSISSAAVVENPVSITADGLHALLSAYCRRHRDWSQITDAQRRAVMQVVDVSVLGLGSWPDAGSVPESVFVDMMTYLLVNHVCRRESVAA